MEQKVHESSFVNPPHKIDGPMKEARESFYELALSKVRFLSNKEIAEWNKEIRGKADYETTASYMIAMKVDKSEQGVTLEKWIGNLDIVVNKDALFLYGRDYFDLLPFILEHELYEAWLASKKGFGQNLNLGQRHTLAERRAYYLAEKRGLSNKLFEYDMLCNPPKKDEYLSALEYAKKKASLENK